MKLLPETCEAEKVPPKAASFSEEFLTLLLTTSVSSSSVRTSAIPLVTVTLVLLTDEDFRAVTAHVISARYSGL